MADCTFGSVTCVARAVCLGLSPVWRGLCVWVCLLCGADCVSGSCRLCGADCVSVVSASGLIFGGVKFGISPVGA